MVETTTGAGTGGLKIVGSLDTTLIERGFTRVKQGFEGVKGRAKSFLADQERMISATKELSKGLLGVGMAGAAAMIALAKGAPAVAAAMAQMSVSMLKLKISAGEALAPAFEKVAGWLDKFAIWTGEHPDLFAGLVISLSAIAALKFVGATGLIIALGKLIVSPSGLLALGILAAGFGAFKLVTGVVDKLREYTGMKDPDAITDMSGQTLLTRLGQRIESLIFGGPTPWEDQTNIASPAYWEAKDKIVVEGYQQTPGGTMTAVQEEDRRYSLLALWDSVWP